MTSPIRTISLVTLATFGLFALCGNAKAAEGGGCHYLPGTVGDITIANNLVDSLARDHFSGKDRAERANQKHSVTYRSHAYSSTKSNKSTLKVKLRVLNDMLAMSRLPGIDLHNDLLRSTKNLRRSKTTWITCYLRRRVESGGRPPNSFFQLYLFLLNSASPMKRLRVSRAELLPSGTACPGERIAKKSRRAL